MLFKNNIWYNLIRSFFFDSHFHFLSDKISAFSKENIINLLLMKANFNFSELDNAEFLKLNHIILLQWEQFFFHFMMIFKIFFVCWFIIFISAFWLLFRFFANYVFKSEIIFLIKFEHHHFWKIWLLNNVQIYIFEFWLILARCICVWKKVFKFQNNLMIIIWW